jgi:hypothetical protein
MINDGLPSIRIDGPLWRTERTVARKILRMSVPADAFFGLMPYPRTTSRRPVYKLGSLNLMKQVWQALKLNALSCTRYDQAPAQASNSSGLETNLLLELPLQTVLARIDTLMHLFR